ncbi:DUF6950 family protein [Aquabacterium sp. OR-4]|uniref:DUF6950 family protein n=1 Tax=Aquabacterium sp. OR-4 TaxID=2978127 RepID=UPI0021B4CA29|nr:hypothetical protein [Aquabacterium sp. OR-4]MDT7836448.1 hypothetical protein [Aquabacterium sp. OR-4]
MSADPAHALADAGLARFFALIEARRAAPFVWGGHDCCLFAADAALALTGKDHAAAWRGRYHCAAGAARLLARLGGLSALASNAGPQIMPLAAGVGDVGLLHHGGRELLGVCVGDVWLSPAAGAGLAAQPLGAALAAWRVGNA